MKWFKQLVINVMYTFYALLYRKKIPSLTNKKIAIIFLASSPQGKFLVPLGEFLIREPFFRYLSTKKNELVLVTDKKEFMSFPPFSDYFSKIASLETFLSDTQKYDIVILAQNNLYLPLREIRLKSSFIISYAHQWLSRQPRFWKYIDFFPKYYVGGRHELLRSFDSIGTSINLHAKEYQYKINIKAPQKDQITFALMAESNAKSLSLEENIQIIKSILATTKKTKIYLVGDEFAKSMAKAIKSQIKSPRIIDYTSKVSLSQAAKIMAASKVVVSPDTGSAHLAASLGKPLIVYYISTVLDRWKPLGDAVYQYKVAKDKVSQEFKDSLAKLIC